MAVTANKPNNVSRSIVINLSRFAPIAARVLCGAMPALILPLIDAVAHWPERGALVGLDLGTKTIGVAVSDPDRRLATGVETIARKNFSADAARSEERRVGKEGR